MSRRREGGNAFDAAVAAGFMEAVVSPHNCGIGGYGGHRGRLPRRGSGRSWPSTPTPSSPRAATPTMFPVIPARDPNDYRLASKSHKEGPLSVAVPGVLGGLLTMLETWGTLDRAAVMAPAIRRAREGVALTPGQALTWLTMKAEAEGRPAPGRADVPAVVPMPELAETLEAIAAGGAWPSSTRGRIGRAIADHVGKLGGILTPRGHGRLSAPRSSNR